MATLNEKIVPVDIEDEMKGSYIDYSMSVIVARALPDVRDGLKPVHRRVLYGMLELGLGPTRPYKKSARIVGEVLGKYHPHGDSAVYDTMVRLAQEFSMRYPLVDGQGNFGSVDGDSPAAMRYTEARLTRLAEEMLRDLQKNTVDLVPNFDETLTEPSVLPALAPNLLINGASGIAVGMATNIPPHNLAEIVDGCMAIIDEPGLTPEKLMRIVKAPDFPTGGIIYGYDGVRQAYLTGRGRLVVRARATVETGKGDRQSIVVSEIPYQVNKAGLIAKIADLVNEKKLEDISDIRDESDRDGLRVVIELRRDANAGVVLNNLYRHTQLQVTFGVNMLALVDGRPRVLTLAEALQKFITHRNEVIVRRSRYELDEAEKRAHILEGYIIALENIDAIVRLIKASRDVEAAKTGLMKKFKLSEIQAKAILDMRLQRLTGLERKKVEQEYRETIKLIERLRAILKSKQLQMQIIKEELLALKKQFGDPRRTEIVYKAEEFNIEDMIAEEQVVVTISHMGFVKRSPVSGYRRQSRGGRGSTGAATRGDDFIEHVFVAGTHDYLLLFTDRGRCYWLKVFEIPEGGRATRGKSIAALVAKGAEENITSFVTVKNFEDPHYVMMVTRGGIIKKTSLVEFSNPRRSGILAVTLGKGDMLIDVKITDGSQDIVIGTTNGLAIRFSEREVRAMGRSAGGVRAIRLGKNDAVIGSVGLRRSGTSILVATQRGYGKRSETGEYRISHRGGKGVITVRTTEKTGKMVCIREVVDSDDIVIVTSGGKAIRQHASEIRIAGRNTQGVRLIKLGEGDVVADVAAVVADDSDIAGIPPEPSGNPGPPVQEPGPPAGKKQKPQQELFTPPAPTTEAPGKRSPKTPPPRPNQRPKARAKSSPARRAPKKGRRR